MKPNARNVVPPTTFSDGMSRVRVDRFHMSVCIPNSTCSLENWINFSSTRHGGVGPSYTFLAIIGQARHDVEYCPSGSYKSIPNKWQPKIPSLLPSYGTSYGIKHKARKEVASVWSIIHKVVAVNEWHGKISIDINKKMSSLWF